MNSFRRKMVHSTGFEPSIHGLRGEHFTNELFDLLMNVHKSSVYQVHKIRCLQINQVYAIVTKEQIMNDLEQNAV